MESIQDALVAKGLDIFRMMSEEPRVITENTMCRGFSPEVLD